MTIYAYDLHYEIHLTSLTSSVFWGTSSPSHCGRHISMLPHEIVKRPFLSLKVNAFSKAGRCIDYHLLHDLWMCTPEFPYPGNCQQRGQFSHRNSVVSKHVWNPWSQVDTETARRVVTDFRVSLGRVQENQMHCDIV